MRWQRLVMGAAALAGDRALGTDSGQYVVVPSQRNQNFACCGGCSSGVRADAALLPLGARIVLWDATVMVSPAEQCLVTFPFDPSNGELPGSRRVRSGKLVGSTFPLDHDADALCCLNGGQCALSEDDATGRCDCVVQYGFQGAHCELTVYDIAASNNSLVYPKTFAPTPFTIELPDLRHALESFPIAQPLLQTLLASTSADSGGSADPSLAEYRQRAFLPAALGVAAAMGLACVFILLALVRCCLKPRVYSTCEKMLTMLLMVGFALLSALSLGWAGQQWAALHDQSDTLTTLVDDLLPAKLSRFYTTMATPLAAALQGSNSTSIPAFQKRTADQMKLYAQLNQTDMQGLFQEALEPLKAVAMQFPTAAGCENAVLLRSSISVMSVGAATGCFQCPKCASITTNIQQIQLDWFRGVQAVHFILYQSHANLAEFSTLSLEPQLESFQRSLNHTKTTVELHTQRLSGMLASLTNSFTAVLDCGLYLWWPLSFVTTSTSIAAAVVGVKFKSGKVGRGASWLAQLTTLLGFGLTGVAWSLAYCARDGIALMQSFDQNATVLVPDSTASTDAWNILHDKSLVANHSLSQLLSFADIVKVPPLATPQDRYNRPERYDFAELFRFQGLVDLQARFDPTSSAVLETLFSWDESIVSANRNLLTTLVGGNQTTPSPYAATSVNLTHAHTMASLLQTFNATWPTLTPATSAVQNQRIASQWLVCATFEGRRRELVQYVSEVNRRVGLTRPVLDAIQANSSRLEALEHQLKTDMEFFTTMTQQFKLADCGLRGNCAWARSIWNDMVSELLQLGNTADLATACCGIAALSQLLCAVFASCFATRIQKPKVRIYAFAEAPSPEKKPQDKVGT